MNKLPSVVPWYICPECGTISHNSEDKAEGYCSACKKKELLFPVQDQYREMIITIIKEALPALKWDEAKMFRFLKMGLPLLMREHLKLIEMLRPTLGDSFLFHVRPVGGKALLMLTVAIKKVTIEFERQENHNG